MKILKKAKEKIAEHQRLAEIKKEYGLSRFHLYREKGTGIFILSRSDWASVKNRHLRPVRKASEFLSFIKTYNVSNQYRRFRFDEEPDRYYTNIREFIEEYLIVRLAGL